MRFLYSARPGKHNPQAGLVQRVTTMSITQPLFLELSTGLVLSKRVRAVNLDTYHVEGRCPAVVLWHKDDAEPLYFPHGSSDAEAVKAWADTQLEEQFLRMPSCLFAVSDVELATVDDTSASIQLTGDPLRFAFPGIVARHALLLWAGEATLPALQAVQA
jgi:hypothetical protein